MNQSILDKLNIKKNKAKNKTIAQKFGAYISVLVFITVIFMTIYFLGIIYLFTLVKNDWQQTVENFSNSIIENYQEELINNKYKNFNNAISNSISKNALSYVYIIDPNNKVKYSSHKAIKQNQQINIPIITNEKILQNGDIIKIASFDKYTPIANNISISFVAIGCISILFGFISAPILAKFVTKPIEELYVGAIEISNKNLSYRIPIKTNDEIGKLAESFNEMAHQLEENYKNLESKVRERTQELEQAYKDLQETQVKLVHTEKMSSLGQLVAGIAHELNNPINFIYGNLQHLDEYVQSMETLINKYTEFESALIEMQQTEIKALKEDIEYDYITEDVQDLLRSCKEGCERTRQIVIDLRNFSRLDEANLKEINIHDGIDSTLNILSNSYKNRIKVIKNYDKNIPLVDCFAGQINQVFMNILANAAQSIKEEGDVTITTSQEDQYVKIVIADTGCGIPEEIVQKIFDPFFTTKDVGEGTGLGLSISYNIIAKHHGIINVDSEINKGTTFTIKLPIKWTEQKT